MESSGAECFHGGNPREVREPKARLHHVGYIPKNTDQQRICQVPQSKLHFKAAISEMEYAKIYFAPAKDVFFKGSFIEMMRFILQNEQPAQKDIDELRTLLDEIQKK